jgi:hypothetical protein
MSEALTGRRRWRHQSSVVESVLVVDGSRVLLQVQPRVLLELDPLLVSLASARGYTSASQIFFSVIPARFTLKNDRSHTNNINVVELLTVTKSNTLCWNRMNNTRSKLRMTRKISGGGAPFAGAVIRRTRERTSTLAMLADFSILLYYYS